MNHEVACFVRFEICLLFLSLCFVDCLVYTSPPPFCVFISYVVCCGLFPHSPSPEPPFFAALSWVYAVCDWIAETGDTRVCGCGRRMGVDVLRVWWGGRAREGGGLHACAVGVLGPLTLPPPLLALLPLRFVLPSACSSRASQLSYVRRPCRRLWTPRSLREWRFAHARTCTPQPRSTQA